MKRTTLFILCFLLAQILMAQLEFEKTALGPAGDQFEYQGLSLDWTLSEIAIESFEGSPDIFLGFFLPDIITAVNEFKEKIQINISPNPCSGILIISSDETREILAEVFDQHGKMVLARAMKLDGIGDEMNISFLPVATYYVRITDTRRKIFASFKIQKI